MNANANRLESAELYVRDAMLELLNVAPCDYDTLTTLARVAQQLKERVDVAAADDTRGRVVRRGRRP